MPKKYQLVSNYRGYVTKPDQTNTSIRNLTAGSQNVLVNDAEKVESRRGFTLDGQANAAITPIESSFDWQTSTAIERNLRGYDDELEFRFVDSDGNITWEKLADGWAAADFQFTVWWDTSEAIDLLIFVIGDDNLYDWSGLVTTFASATATTVTKEGTTTWAQERALSSGTRTIRIKDDGGTWREFTYTGGEDTTTLTGISPDPTAFTISAGNPITQKIRTNSNEPEAGLQNDFIATLNNQIYVGSLITNEIFVSSNSDFTDFTFSSPRVPGDGALLTLDGPGVGLAPQEDVMYITAGKSDWYQVSFTLSDDNTRENIAINKLKTGPQQAAQSQNMIGKAKNNVVFISNEPTLDNLGRVQEIITPQSRPISDPIKPDFDSLNFANADIKYFKNQVFIAVPAESLVYIYDIDKGYWQSPQVLPVRKLAIIGDELYGHSNAVPETYKLFAADTFNDNSNPISFKVFFSYRNFGDRQHQKNMNDFFSEGYIAANTVLNLRLRYDYKSSSGEFEFEIDGGNDDIIFDPVSGGPLGTSSLGIQPIGSLLETPDDLAKFRVIHQPANREFYEMQAVYEVDAVDARFEILAHGPSARLSPNQPIGIKI